MSGSKAARGDFANGSIKRLILNQAVPLTLAQLVQLLYNVVDRVYIGHMPGADAGTALTGLGLCFPLITLISAFVNLFSTGASPLCSMARGKKDQKTAQDIMSTAFTLLLIMSVVIGLLIYIVKRPVLYLLGASDVTYTYAEDYLDIYLIGTAFLAIGTGMNTFINLQGYPKLGMFTTIIGAVINLGLDPLFIFTFGMGVKGAAIATVISQMCSAIWVVVSLTNKKMELRISFSSIRIHTNLLKRIITLGLPGFIMAATNCVVQAVCNAELSIYGGDIYVGIMTVINSVREMSSLPISGITSGSQPVLSYNYGANRYNRVKQGIRFMALVALGYTAVFWVATLLIPQVFMHMFSSDATANAMGLAPLRIYFLGFIFMALQFAGQSTFVDLGRAKNAIFFSILRKIIIVVPLTILLPRISSIGVMGVFWAEPISNLIGGVACASCMYFTVYRKLGK